jgi:hypothetical protein
VIGYVTLGSGDLDRSRAFDEIPPRDFAGRGTARSAVEGFCGV